MGIKINLPKNPITKEEIKARNRAMFKEDFDKGGVLAKILVFITMNEPAQSKELQEKLHEYYRVGFDINHIKRGVRKLNELGILHSITSGEMMTMPQNELSDLVKSAYGKFFLYLEHIPKQFRRQYNQVIYYWVPKGSGEDYLEWCCNLLGFEIEKQNKEKQNGKN